MLEELLLGPPPDDLRVQWVNDRQALERQTGKSECRLYDADIFTDDLFLEVVNLEFYVVAVECWVEQVDTVKMRMAIALKHQAGAVIV